MILLIDCLNYKHHGFTHTLNLGNQLFIYNYYGLTNSLILEINYFTYKLYELTNHCVDAFSMCLSQVHNEQGWHGGARIPTKAINFTIIRKLIYQTLKSLGPHFVNSDI